MSQTAVSTQIQEGNGEKEVDPRMTIDFQTLLVNDGPQKDLSAYIFYSKVSEDGTKPTEKDLPFLTSNFTDARRVVVHDARGLKKTIDQNGFEYITHPKPGADYSNVDSVRRFYYPAMMHMIKEKSAVLPIPLGNLRTDKLLDLDAPRSSSSIIVYARLLSAPNMARSTTRIPVL